MTEPLAPLRDNIIVRRVPNETQTAGGIVLPGQAQTKTDEGYVIAVGPGKVYPNGTKMPMETKVGDRVVFTKYQHLTFSHKGEELITLCEADVIGILEEA